MGQAAVLDSNFTGLPLEGKKMNRELSDAELDGRLVELVNQWWTTHSRPLLLSQLGEYDDGNLTAAIKGKARGLAAYIRNRLGDHIDVIRHDEKPQLVGAIPAGVDVAELGGANALLEETGSRPSGSARFHRAFWAAFRQPLDDSKSRYMSLNAPVHFQDISLGESRPEGFTEVDRAYIVDTEDAVQVQAKIEEWLAVNSLDSAAFEVSKRQESKPLPANLLGRLLDALSPDQLARINMPLDVVDQLRREAP